MSTPQKAVNVRWATSADAASVAGLLAALGYPNAQRGLEKRIASHADSQTAAVFVAVCSDEIIGLASFQLIPLFHADGFLGRITSFVVSDSHRRRGVGRLLVSAIEEFADKNGCERIEVTSGDRRDDAHSFYQHLGYEPVSRRFLKIRAPKQVPGPT
jgi:GNAT superfamily N-acetyltransferase